jgi:SAM-dependent methyltransferase
MLHDWFETPPGRYVLQWEQQQIDAAVCDAFGYHALQLGLVRMDALATNRMPHRWTAIDRLPVTSERQAEGVHTPRRPAQLVTDFAQLPFAEGSLDLVVMPHTLELSADPHASLREAERVLMPEGRLVICGFNPTSLWGLRQRRARAWARVWGPERLAWGSQMYLPEAGEFIGYWRLRDWLRLLGLEVQAARFGCYIPAVRTERWIQRLRGIDRIGARWWPIFGAVYFVEAVKRVPGTRLMAPNWKLPRVAARSPVPATGAGSTSRCEGPGSP